MIEHDLLTYLGLTGILVVLVVAARVLATTPDVADLETRKIRFAAATFTGILMLMIFAMILYLETGEAGVGKTIFEKTLTAMAPLAGVIVGYLFQAMRSPSGR